jgi:hypothetical protein
LLLHESSASFSYPSREPQALEDLARGWSAREREICAAETPAAFGGGGSLLKQLAVAGDAAPETVAA